MKHRGLYVILGFVFLLLVVVWLVQSLVGPELADRLPGSEPDMDAPSGDELPDTLAGEIEGIYQVHFIDVGQGDAILVRAPGYNMLIDGGDRHAGVLEYLLELAIDTLNTVVSTHPHADHIGGLPAVLNNFVVLEVIDPGVVHTTRLFTNYLELIDSLNIPFIIGRAGMRRELDSLSYFKILHPLEPSDRHLNDASVVVWFVFDQIRVLLPGDIERRSEAEILERSPDLKSQVLKVAHHGSRTSSTAAFLEAVNPEAAVIFVGEDNRYGFPHQETEEQLAAMNVLVFRTDLSGTIVMHSDGTDYFFETESGGAISAPDSQPGSIRRIDINTASLEELTLIIHIGPARAREVISRRPFSSLEELIEVPGIDSRRLEDIRKQNIAIVNQPI